MSDYTAMLGLGAEVRISINDVYTVIPWVQSVTFGGITFDIVDVTTHSSPNGFREKIAGLADGGDLTFTVNWHDDETTHQELWEAQQAREVVPFQVALPMFETNNLFNLDAFVSGLTFEAPTDAQVTQAVTLTITGNIEKSTE